MENLLHKLNLALEDASSTREFARKVGAKLKGGEVIELIGDLGAGKTTFVIGLSRGAGITELVSSPSFTIRNDYANDSLSIAHYDLFRISDPGELKELLAESLDDLKTVVVVEWADSLSHILPKDRIKLRLMPTKKDSRLIEITYPDRYSYLFEGEA